MLRDAFCSDHVQLQYKINGSSLSSRDLLDTESSVVDVRMFRTEVYGILIATVCRLDSDWFVLWRGARKQLCFFFPPFGTPPLSSRYCCLIFILLKILFSVV